MCRDMRATAPWKCFADNDIHEGDIILHPSGQRGVVVYLPEELSSANAWLVRYDDGTLSRLCLQVGDKGMGILYHKRG